MGLFKNIIEPGVIAAIFTVCTLFNRRDRRHLVRRKDEEDLPQPLSIASNTQTSDIPRRDTGPSRNTIFSRIFFEFPFIVEIVYWLLTYWIYQGLRAYSATHIRGNTAIFARAQSHAEDILWLEQKLGIAIEQAVQQSILANLPSLMIPLRWVYHSHIIVGVVVFAYGYTFFPRPIFRAFRRTLALDNLMSFIVFSIYRCTPPRLLPPEYGYVDVLHTGSHAVTGTWTSNRFQLTIAAMPSLHFGTSALIAWTLAEHSPHALIRQLAFLWPGVMGLTIIATANHWILDALVGVLLPIIGWRANRVWCVLDPVSRQLCKILGIEDSEDDIDNH